MLVEGVSTPLHAMYINSLNMFGVIVSFPIKQLKVDVGIVELRILNMKSEQSPDLR